MLSPKDFFFNQIYINICLQETCSKCDKIRYMWKIYIKKTYPLQLQIRLFSSIYWKTKIKKKTWKLNMCFNIDLHLRPWWSRCQILNPLYILDWKNIGFMRLWHRWKFISLISKKTSELLIPNTISGFSARIMMKNYLNYRRFVQNYKRVLQRIVINKFYRTKQFLNKSVTLNFLIITSIQSREKKLWKNWSTELSSGKVRC